MTSDNTLEITLDTWIISDTHFFHENIGRYCSRPENWQELIIKNWNDLVSPDETVLHLGDFALGNKNNFDLLSGMLRGRLFLIQGNHDRISKSYCETRGVTLIKNSLNVQLSDQMKLIFHIARSFLLKMVGSIYMVISIMSHRRLKVPIWDRTISI